MVSSFFEIISNHSSNSRKICFNSSKAHANSIKTTIKQRILNCFPLLKRLFTGTVPVNKAYLTGTVPVNKMYLTGRVPVNKAYLTGTVPVNKVYLTGTLFQTYIVKHLNKIENTSLVCLFFHSLLWNTTIWTCQPF